MPNCNFSGYQSFGLVHFEKRKGRPLVPRARYSEVVLDLSLRAGPVSRRKAARASVP